jgi:hypothetical protein
MPEADANFLDPNADPLTVAGILSAVRGDPNALAAARVRGNPKLQRLSDDEAPPSHDWRADAAAWSKVLQDPNSFARHAAQSLTGTGGYAPGATPNEDAGLLEIPPLAVQPRSGQLPQGPDPNRPAATPVAQPERYPTWLEKTMVSGATMPRDVAAGQYGSGLTEESAASMIPRTQDITALAGAPVPAETGAAGVFGGKLSRTADLQNLGKASKMEAVGAPAADIWNETGWFRGGDRQWKYEIPDTGATAINRGVRDEGNLLNPEYMGPLSDFLNHPELYEAYPSTRSIPTNISINPEEGTSGFHWRATGDRPSRLGLQTPIEWGDPNVGGMDPAIFHELDHVLQQREGFARGSNPEAELGRVAGRPVPPEFISKGITPERWQQALADELYRRQAGEVSARNAENRYGLAMLGRPEATSLPNLTEDVPRSKQIVTFRSDTQDPAAVIAALKGGAKTSGHEFFNVAKSETEGPQGAQSGQLGRGEGGPGGAGGVEEAQRAATEAAGARQPLEGLPTKPLKIGDSHYVPGPSEQIHQVADDYMRGAGLPYNPPKQYIPVNKERAGRIAQAFEDMPHAPTDPSVRASYEALADETLAQFQAIKNSGLKIDFIKPGQKDPYYESPRLANQDMRDNNHLWVYPTESGHGTPEGATGGGRSKSSLEGSHENVMLRPTGETINGHPLLVNDVFRIVHDYFGHFKDGNGFRADGEENAWRSHSAMYSDLARPAMTSETRGQNSWTNYGPHGEKNRTAKTEDTVFADQKIGLMPPWVSEEGRHDTSLFEGGGKPAAVIAALKKGKAVEAPSVIPSKPTYITDEGLPIQGRQYALAQAAAKKEIKQGPKGAGPLDLSSQAEIPNVPQSELERYNPKHGVSDRLQDALKNEQVKQGVADSIDEGVKIGADKWYHTEPVRRAFENVYGKDEGQGRYSNFATFMDMVAATSPRSDVSTNIRNASYYFQHALQGKELPEKLPYPYGHVAQNLHRQNFETLTEPGSPGWDLFTNPKPPSFSQNLQGNLMPGTIDTHAFRNIGMRTKDPRFLETSVNQKYSQGKNSAEDSLAQKYGDTTTRPGFVTYRPRQLFAEGKLTMDEALKLPTFWSSKPKKNEYGVAEQFYRALGEEKGLKTAEAQSAAWSGAGGLTGLGSPPTHTFSELFNEQVLFTAMVRRENPRDTLINAITGKKPLLSNTIIPGGAAAAGQALQNYVPPSGPAPGVAPWKQ